MKANEFIKKFGLDVAIKLSNEMTGITQDVADCVACWGQSEWDYLKRLVRSNELVGRYGTADEAKEYLPMLRMDSYDELKQAILDVESCQ